jgi:hypothetical protein
MKILAALSLSAAAVLVASLAAPLNAQSQAEKSKEETKVYAYQKRLPETPPADPVAAVQRRQAPTPSYLSDEIAYGAPGWWREHERLSGGAGGSE